MPIRAGASLPHRLILARVARGGLLRADALEDQQQAVHGDGMHHLPVLQRARRRRVDGGVEAKPLPLRQAVERSNARGGVQRVLHRAHVGEIVGLKREQDAGKGLAFGFDANHVALGRTNARDKAE